MAFIISDSRAGDGLRDFLDRRSRTLGELARCGFCTGVWIALAATIFGNATTDINYASFVVHWLALAWLAGMQWAAMNALLTAAGK